MKINFLNLIEKFVIGDKKTLLNKVWISQKEVTRYFNLVIWITFSHEHRNSFNELKENILRIWKNSGSEFLFKYLKECLLIVVLSLSGKTEKRINNDIFVKTDRNGLPVIIPFKLRSFLNKEGYQNNRVTVIGIISCLSIFRVLKTFPKVDFSSITDGFTGNTRNLDSHKINLALKDLFVDTPNIKCVTKFIGGLSAGPNSKKALWGAEIDSLAFLHCPTKLFTLLRLLDLRFGIYLIFLIIICSPYYLLSRLFGSDQAQMGRLSVVKDQAGKARIVAITNWWIQLALKPLHTEIFHLLKRLSHVDGTFDQQSPIRNLVKRLPEGTVLHGFDLSAATDRLPVDLQGTILNLLGYRGDLWIDLLDISWLYASGKSKRYVSYAVGQPMGAYSSWGMLALTHHVIVRYASLNVGIKGFCDYCVLGDDIVIANELVSIEYLKLMETLGVKINLSKSIVSSRFTEFAKKLIGKDIDLSPIGPGLILQTVRHRSYLIRFLTETMTMNIVHMFNVPALLDNIKLSSSKRKFISLALCYMQFLSNSTFDPLLGDDVSRTLNGRTYWTIVHPSIKNIISLVEEQIIKERTALLNSVKYFILKGWRVTQLRAGLPALSDLLYFPISPGFWYSIFSFYTSYKDIKAKRERLDYIISESLSTSTEGIKELIKLGGMTSIHSVDFNNVAEVKDDLKRISLLCSTSSFDDTIGGENYFEEVLYFHGSCYRPWGKIVFSN